MWHRLTASALLLGAFTTTLCLAPDDFDARLENALRRAVFSNDVMLTLVGQKPVTQMDIYPIKEVPPGDWKLETREQASLFFAAREKEIAKDWVVLEEAFRTGRLSSKRIGALRTPKGILFYSRAGLQRMVDTPSFRDALSAMGFKEPVNVDSVITWMQEKHVSLQTNPGTNRHEKLVMGMLYGYPEADVRGFIADVKPATPVKIQSARGESVDLFMSARGDKTPEAQSIQDAFRAVDDLVTAQHDKKGRSFAKLWNDFDSAKPGRLPRYGFRGFCDQIAGMLSGD